MEELTKHQPDEYLTYKEVAKSITSKTALPKLVTNIRQVQASRAKCLPDFKSEWQIDYWRQGEQAYSIRQSGVIFFASTPDSLAQPLERDWLPQRVSAETLLELEAEVKRIISSVPPKVVPFKRDKKHSEITIRLRYDQGSWFNYSGRTKTYDPERSKLSNYLTWSGANDDWDNYPTEISDLSARILQIVRQNS